MESTVATLNKAAAFAVRQLCPALGAEILGVDLGDPISGSLGQRILDTWHEHLVILFRNQTLDEDSQVRFAETFGAPARITSSRAFSVKHPSVMLISNIREDGKPIGALPDGEMHFHTDQCHQEIPAKATLLYAIEVPSKGGNTLFSNAYSAYEALPEDLQRRIAGRRALNAYTSDTTLRSASYDDARSSCWHPVVRTHPATDDVGHATDHHRSQDGPPHDHRLERCRRSVRADLREPATNHQCRERDDEEDQRDLSGGVTEEP